MGHYCPRCGRDVDPAQHATCPDDGASLRGVGDDSDRRLGLLVDERFRLVEVLGSGGAGVVYRAIQRPIGRQVAVKILSNTSPEAGIAGYDRFVREARLASSLRHPNIVSPVDFGEDSRRGLVYFAMEYIEGIDLETLLSEYCAAVPVAVADEGPTVDDDVTDVLTARQVVNDTRTDDPVRADLDDDEARRLSSLMASASAFDAEAEGRYDDARRDFVTAYDIFPHSNLLLSVARVSEHAGDTDTALEGYRRFVKRRPDYEDRDAVHIRIETLTLERRIARGEPIGSDAATADDTTDRRFFRDFPEPSPVGWTGVTATAVGLSAVIGGSLVASSVDRDFESLDRLRRDGESDAYRRLADDIDSKQSRGKLLLYGGLTLTAAGGALLALDLLYLDDSLRSDNVDAGHSHWTIDPLGYDGATLQWTRRF